MSSENELETIIDSLLKQNLASTIREIYFRELD